MYDDYDVHYIYFSKKTIISHHRQVTFQVVIRVNLFEFSNKGVSLLWHYWFTICPTQMPAQKLCFSSVVPPKIEWVK